MLRSAGFLKPINFFDVEIRRISETHQLFDVEIRRISETHFLMLRSAGFGLQACYWLPCMCSQAACAKSAQNASG